MRRKVYDYIAENPGTTVRRCADALNIADLLALSLINELCRAGVVSFIALPLGNPIEPDTSPFYFVCSPYIEKNCCSKTAFIRKKPPLNIFAGMFSSGDICV